MKVNSNINVENLLSKDEMEDLIGIDSIREIKFLDQHPEFRAYVVAHEGKADGFRNNKSVTLNYVKSAVNSIYNIIKNGIPAYFRHSSGNDREVIGRVVAKTTKVIDDKLHTIAVIYIKPGYRDENLNVASIEVNIEYNNDGEVTNVNNISGIALSNINIDKPGFENAKLVQQLNYFINQEEINHMKLEDVVLWCKENLVKPTQLFEVEDILKDRDVDGQVKKLLQEKHEHARRLETRLGDVEKIRLEESEKFIKQIKEYQTKLFTNRGKEYLTEKLSKITDPDGIKQRLTKKVTEKLIPILDSITDEELLSGKIDELFNEEYKEIEELKSLLTPTPNPENKPDNQPIIPKSYPRPTLTSSNNPENQLIDQQAKELLRK